ncbi:twin-arginine translocase subunit TatC [Rickettsiales endosymbiont of Peranema trichophorum]|uniref:twin-arginine translocase subunit TatC n=1 Tax=Rickettsiales endosymbiont of Peranema trichophorum TaxID=2486577 RepID=UPI001023F0FB|nr:twin-arginine translocase subunit TatC [Rickettsiales endosymbiont of Peranema trichophorum]RZI45632.1 twin-arginine translocase subunit TatC [Rickettsiales endosymbiont of Peranema trichophorum]
MVENFVRDFKSRYQKDISELRTRLFLSILTLAISVSGSFYFAESILSMLTEPLSLSYRFSDGRKLIFTGLMDAFLMHFKVACYAGFMMSLPYISYQVYAFVAPGLYQHEKRTIAYLMIFVHLLFLIGGASGYYLIVPLACRFFLSFESPGHGQSLPILLEARLDQYWDFMLNVMIGCGLVLQLPVFILLLCKFGIITTNFLVVYRKHMIVFFFIIAAIITPPDVVSHVILGTAMVMLYEISILASKIVEKYQRGTFNHTN